ADTLASLQRLRAAGALPVRVSYNLPLADLPHAERMGIRSGWGDPWLRVWGVKAFLDGSLGSRTAEMLDGSGVARLTQDALADLVQRCARAELNVCLHAIGDGAVRRALDALAPHRNAWPMWRPRIEHAQCVHPKDMVRMARIGVIASMQPIHAVADRELADAMWPGVTKQAYAWRALEEAGDRPLELFRGLTQRLVDDLHVVDHGHEVGVAVPPRHDVKVNVVGNPGPGRASDVHARVEAIGSHRLVEDADGAAHGAHEFCGLGVVKILEARFVRDRRHHGVAGVIRKFVQHHDRPLGPPHHQPRVGVVGMLDHAAEQASGSLLAGDVLHPPGRPESMH